MQNSEAVQAWIQGKMATFRILILVSKTEITSREFSFSSRCLRLKIINLDLVSMPDIVKDFFSVSSRSLRLSVRNSRSRLDVRDWIGDILILVSWMKKRLSLTFAESGLVSAFIQHLSSDPFIGRVVYWIKMLFFIGPMSNHCLAMSLSQFLLLLNIS